LEPKELANVPAGQIADLIGLTAVGFEKQTSLFAA
jgi:hypothetical protein